MSDPSAPPDSTPPAPTQPAPTPPVASPPKPSRSGRTLAIGCGLAALLAVGVPGGAWWWYTSKVEAERIAAEEAQAKRVAEETKPALDKLADAGGGPYDIDKTVRVIHEIDLAMTNQASMRDYLAYMATQDYRGVAPEVLDARRKLLELQARLYAKQTEAEDQQAAWEFSRDLVLQTLSVVHVDGAGSLASPVGSFSVNSTQARKLLDDLAREQGERKALLHDIQDLQDELFQGMLDYSTVYYTYVDQWDRLCVLRDRAYLGVQNGDWDTVRDSARAAVALAPQEKEAHLLLALALIEGSDSEGYGEAGRILDQYVQDHPDATAPAFLLRGVLEEKLGNADAARLDFQQSAAYYPKQATALTEMLDPYKMRDWLRKSREGTYILDVYQASMLGAGYFSPDLQLAKMAFDAGDRKSGKQKVMDHFARRRSQQQWTFILQDITYAESLLGPGFRELFPEDSYLDLVVKPTMFGDKLSVGVDNRSPRTLHNATLILVVHFTDTHPGDYEPFPAERTMPALPAHEVTDFGAMSVKLDLWGTEKSVKDVVTHRAILLSDEAVLWVDTDEYKIAEAKEFREAAKKNGAAPSVEMKRKLESAARSLGNATTVEVEPKYGFNDDLVIELPAELALFKPVFTLQYGDQAIKADTNVIDGDHIKLTFKGVANYDGKDAPPPQALRLVMDSVFGSMVLDWSPSGGSSYRFTGARAE